MDSIDPDVDNKANYDEEEEEQGSLNSSDEALLDLLGIGSLHVTDAVEDEGENQQPAVRNSSLPLPDLSHTVLTALFDSHQLLHCYENQSLIVLPSECSIPAEYMRRLTEELIWGGDSIQADKTYETIHVMNQGQVYTKRVLTRLEHFVDAHDGWSHLCHHYLARLVSKALGVESVLYKEKLNIKPAGGSGFAPHLDTPSLRVALGENGPRSFCTVMVAIDDMTEANGCLRVCQGKWTEQDHVELIVPDQDGNPDAGGRAGAIPIDQAAHLRFEPLICKGGTIAIFNGWAPHRSAPNASPFPRRAVFLTYNPRDEGDFHKLYYHKMEEKRRWWRESVGIGDHSEEKQLYDRLEMDALSTIPKT